MTLRGPKTPRNYERLVAGAMVTAGLTLISTAIFSTYAGAATQITVAVAQNKSWGPTLSLKNGDTLYRLSKDSKDKSTCTGACLSVWTPVVLATGQKVPVGDGVSHLGSFTRSNGQRQITYEGLPLYTFVGDTKAGDVNGNVSDTWGHWHSINPANPLVAPTKKGTSGTTTTTSGGYY